MCRIAAAHNDPNNRQDTTTTIHIGAKPGDIAQTVLMPDADAAHLRKIGVTQVYTPKDFELNAIVLDIVAIVAPDSGHINVG